MQGQDMTGGMQSLNNAQKHCSNTNSLSAIQQLTTEKVPNIGYLIGNGQPLSYNVYDLIERTLKPSYGFQGSCPSTVYILFRENSKALLVVKPTVPFNDDQKLKLDQYVMQGGKIIWMIDKLYAEMDSLMRRQADFIAYDRNLNLDDLLFKYGVRINGDLVQDLQCDQLPMVVGNYGDKPQMELQPWQYFPLLSAYNNNPVSGNMDRVLSIFPNSIDTVKAPGISKTVLLASSANARTLATPALVSLSSVKTEDDIKSFNRAAYSCCGAAGRKVHFSLYQPSLTGCHGYRWPVSINNPSAPLLPVKVK